MPENVSYEAAAQLVQDVSSWFTEQIIAERRAAAPDEERLRMLREGLAACAADREVLRTASPQEIAEIASRYAARSQELRGR